MAKVILQNEWLYNPRQKEAKHGSFGWVYFGSDSSKSIDVAIKMLNKHDDDSGHREMDIADILKQQNLRYVLPILEHGIDDITSKYCLIMPKAEKSLQDEIDNIGRFEEKEAIKILIDIANGLQEVENLVHRDLKPSNILLHDGKWKIADFGIARNIKKVTSKKTMKKHFTSEYASPEQWNKTTPSKKTDIYALGCIAYELLSGELPYEASTEDEWQRAHISETAKTLPPTFDGKLRSLITQMLDKNEKRRPPTSEVIIILEDVLNQDRNKPSILRDLANIGALEVEKKAKESAERESSTLKRNQRKSDSMSAIQSLLKIIENMVKLMSNEIPDLKVERRDFRVGHSLVNSHEVSLGKTVLGFSYFPSHVPENSFPNSKWDVISAAKIRVWQEDPKAYDWSTSLFFTNLGKNEQYRWHDVPFFRGAFGTLQLTYEPSSIDNFQAADYAISNQNYSTMGTPCPIDFSNEEIFIERWLKLFTLAYAGKLHYLGQNSSRVKKHYCDNSFLKM